MKYGFANTDFLKTRSVYFFLKVEDGFLSVFATENYKFIHFVFGTSSLHFIYKHSVCRMILASRVSSRAHFFLDSALCLDLTPRGPSLFLLPLLNAPSAIVHGCTHSYYSAGDCCCVSGSPPLLRIVIFKQGTKFSTQAIPLVTMAFLASM